MYRDERFDDKGGKSRFCLAIGCAFVACCNQAIQGSSLDNRLAARKAAQASPPSVVGLSAIEPSAEYDDATAGFLCQYGDAQRSAGGQPFSDSGRWRRGNTQSWKGWRLWTDPSLLRFLRFMDSSEGIPPGGSGRCPSPATEDLVANAYSPYYRYPLCGHTLSKYGLVGTLAEDCAHLKERNASIVREYQDDSGCRLIISVSDLENTEEDGDPGFFCSHLRGSSVESRFVLDLLWYPAFLWDPVDSKGRAIPRTGYIAEWRLEGEEDCQRGHPAHSVPGGFDEYRRRSPDEADKRLARWNLAFWKVLLGVAGETARVKHECVVHPQDLH